MFNYNNVRYWLLKESAESGNPLEFLDVVRTVLEDIEEHATTDDEIKEEVWGDEE